MWKGIYNTHLHNVIRVFNYEGFYHNMCMYRMSSLL